MKKKDRSFSGSRLHRAMQKAHITAQVLSDRASAGGREISLRVVERFVSGSQKPNKNQIIRLAEALEIDVNDLYITESDSGRSRQRVGFAQMVASA